MSHCMYKRGQWFFIMLSSFLVLLYSSLNILEKYEKFAILATLKLV